MPILRINNFSASSGLIKRFKGRSKTVDTTLSRETAEDWNNYRLLQEIEGYDLCDIYHHMLVTTHRVLIANWIYWTLITCNYK
jgi:hypothetical protein